jgi:hypothetical protein
MPKWRTLMSRSSKWAWKLLRRRIMNGNGQLTVSETAARRVRKTKSSAHKSKGRSRSGSRNGSRNGNGGAKAVTHDLPAAGTLARTKALLLAALRVWELKHRVSE